jgi:hypothetical protein
VNVDLSSKFSDWIEANLLKLDSFRTRSVSFDTSKVDPEAGRIIPGDKYSIERKDSAASWTLEGLGPDEEVDSSKVSSLTSALADLKIAGVRPKPAGLTDSLKATGGGKEGLSLTQASLRSLEARGFYVLRDGRLVSNQGDVIPTTDEGIGYTLRFGEVTFATGEALSAGSSKEDAAKSAADEKKKPEGAKESRYLFVTAAFDASLLPPPPTPLATDGELPADTFQLPGKERADKAKADKEKYDREKGDYDRKVEDGQKRAKELTDRFAGWYYVVPGDAFRSIVLDRASLVKKKDDKAGTSNPSVPPNLFGPGSVLPPSGRP